MKPSYHISRLAGAWHIVVELGNRVILASCTGNYAEAQTEARRQLNAIILEAA